ncbi:hypothetical protein M0R45_000476 [Rubus argutus]|uniref:Uncharacterized protein n=1 Tax=Rubus argutus TaxID=59490 RepID=A0AAW1VKM7_RUBAR
MISTSSSSRLKGESLYLCLYRNPYKQGTRPCTHFVLSIQLSDIFMSSSTDPENVDELDEIISISDQNKLLKVVDFTSGPDEDPHFQNCAVFDSNIVVAGIPVSSRSTSRQIVVLTCKPTTTHQRSLKDIIKPFNKPKSTPFLKEIKGKLYALAYSPRRYFHIPMFEVFDRNQEQWIPLPNPPVINESTLQGYIADRFDYRLAVAGTKFLVSSECKEGVFLLDVDEEHPEWRRQDSLGKSLPRELDWPFVVEDVNGGSFVMFRYTHWPQQTLSVFLMSHQCDSLEIMKPLQLPKLPAPFFPGCCLSYAGFFDLGDRQVCLILHTFFSPIKYDEKEGKQLPWDDDRDSKGIFVFVPFEYEITTCSQVTIRFLLCANLSTPPWRWPTMMIIQSWMKF